MLSREIDRLTGVLAIEEDPLLELIDDAQYVEQKNEIPSVSHSFAVVIVLLQSRLGYFPALYCELIFQDNQLHVLLLVCSLVE